MQISFVTLPHDGGPHKAMVEWWYYNGLLESEDGRRFAYMLCLFKVDNKKVKVPLLSRLPFKTVYFCHSLISDITKQKFYPTVDYFSVISKDSFTHPLMFVNFTNPFSGFSTYINSMIEEEKQGMFHLKRGDFDLRLQSMKQALLENGTGFVKLHDRSTYYYSYTNLVTEGTIIVGKEKIKVKGKSWMDHQWADNRYAQDKWVWFSIQLENNVEFVCAKYENGGNTDFFADIIYPDGRQEHAEDVVFTALDKGWQSKKTKAKYNLAWKIEITSKNICLETEPEIDNQEMLFGTINYWEGPLKVRGEMGGLKVNGQGFLELVGEPIQYGAVKLASQVFDNIKSKVI